MAMASNVLAVELLALVPVATEAEAVVTLSNAYAEFAADAVAGEVAITAAGVELGKVAMQAGLVGMNAPNAGVAKITSAVIAFWTAVAGGLSTSFAGATAITFPPHAGLAALLTATLATNLATSADRPTATNAMAVDLYNQAIVGGSVTFPGPTVVAIT